MGYYQKAISEYMTKRGIECIKEGGADEAERNAKSFGL